MVKEKGGLWGKSPPFWFKALKWEVLETKHSKSLYIFTIPIKIPVSNFVSVGKWEGRSSREVTPVSVQGVYVGSVGEWR